MDFKNDNGKLNNRAVENFAIRLIESILPGSFQSHFCLAGGCFKSLIHNKKPNDIDLWPTSEEDRLILIEELISNGGVIEHEGEFNTVIKFPTSNNEDITGRNLENTVNESQVQSQTLLNTSGASENCRNLKRLEGIVICSKIEVTTKCPPSLEECLAEFDLVLSYIGVEFCKGKIIQTYIHPNVQKDIYISKPSDILIINKEVNMVKEIKLHRYNLLSLHRLHRYASELSFYVPKNTIDFLWTYAYFNRSEKEKRDLLQYGNLTLADVPLRT